MGSLRTTRCCALGLLTFNLLVVGGVSAQDDDPLFGTGWRVSLAPPPVAPPAYDEARAYVPLQDGSLTAVDLADGTVAWTVTAPTRLRPAAGDGLVYVVDAAAVHALDATDGGPRWSTPLSAPPAIGPRFDGGWLFVGTDTGRISTLRAADGAVLWVYDGSAPLSAFPAPAGSRVYLPLANGRLVAADLLTGNIVWERRLRPPLSEVLALGERLFVGSGDHHFYCLSVSSGRDVWRWRTGGDIVGAPVVDETRVFFLSLDNTLRALDRRSGRLHWLAPLPTRVVGGPLRSRSFAILSSLYPRLQAYDREDGTLEGQSAELDDDDLSSTVLTAPHIVSRNENDAFVVLTRQGTLQLFTYGKEPLPSSPFGPPMLPWAASADPVAPEVRDEAPDAAP